jgi:2'-hydroxyisoflavone reductase
MGDMLETCRTESGSDARFTWVDEAFLIERGVEPWSELPLWLPESSGTHGYFHRAAIGRAVAAGLTFRPLAETVRDTLAWQRSSEGRPLPARSGVALPDTSLSAGREAALLAEWRERAS